MSEREPTLKEIAAELTAIMRSDLVTENATLRAGCEAYKAMLSQAENDITALRAKAEGLAKALADAPCAAFRDDTVVTCIEYHKREACGLCRALAAWENVK